MRVDGHVLFAAALAIAATGLAAPVARAADDPLPELPRGPFTNEYSIEVRLDAERMVLEGRERILFRNVADAPVEVVSFHLYPNAFANSATDWVEDARVERRMRERGAADAGYLQIDAIADGAGADLAAATEIDGTLMRVRMPAPIEPGGEAALDVAFTTKLPRIVARMGHIGEHVAAMQWYPKLCKFTDGRFLEQPFREPSEFFADFGLYRVEIDVPERFVVDATGEIVRTSEAEGRRTTVFEAAAVHDFAWAADPNFVRHEAESAAGVEIVLLAQPYMEPKAALVLDAARFALDRYGEWFFPYPYPRLVIVVVPHGEDGGMEYPMLFTIGERAPEFLPWLRERSEEPAGVTVHEFGHQYFQGMVATDERAEAWLDEGITTYVTGKVLEDFLPERGAARGLPLVNAKLVAEPLLERAWWFAEVAGYAVSPFHEQDRTTTFGFRLPDLALEGTRDDRFRARRDAYGRFAGVSPLATTAWQAYRDGSGNAYRSIAYAKPTLLLRTLEGIAGEDAVFAMLRAWARRHAFRHPGGGDFLRVVEETLGETCRDLVVACIERSDTVDLAVEEVRAIRERAPVGFAVQERPGAAVQEAPGAAEEEAGALDLLAGRVPFLGRATHGARDREGAGTGGAAWRGEVVVRNRGALAVPYEVELRFADGTTERRAFDGRQRWTRIEVAPRASRLVAAIVDPQRRIALDLDVTNNGRLARPDGGTGLAFGALHQFWMQAGLTSVSWF